MRRNGEYLMFPHRGPAPACPEGFLPTGDPYIFIEAIQECVYRQVTERKTACCMKVILKCALKDSITTHSICKECQDAQAV